jgi:hypothetical protein
VLSELNVSGPLFIKKPRRSEEVRLQPPLRLLLLSPRVQLLRKMTGALYQSRRRTAVVGTKERALLHRELHTTRTHFSRSVADKIEQA